MYEKTVLALDRKAHSWVVRFCDPKLAEGLRIKLFQYRSEPVVEIGAGIQAHSSQQDGEVSGHFSYSVPDPIR